MGWHKKIDAEIASIQIYRRVRSSKGTSEAVVGNGPPRLSSYRADGFDGGTYAEASKTAESKVRQSDYTWSAGSAEHVPVVPTRRMTEKVKPDGRKVAVPVSHQVIRNRNNGVTETFSGSPLPPRDTVYVSRTERDAHGLPCSLSAANDAVRTAYDKAAAFRQLSVFDKQLEDIRAGFDRTPKYRLVLLKE